MKRIKTLMIFLMAAMPFVRAYSQEGAYGGYSPYSVFGIGELSKDGNAYNKSMGGVGIATRNKRFLNYMNPAAVTARDSLSFMCDFGITQNNEIYRSADAKSGNNTFNMADFVISFPVYKSSAAMFGITPFSDVGYDFSSIEKDPRKIANVGTMAYQAYGNGGINKFFVAAGVTFWDKLSVGAEFDYFFGNINKITNTVYSESSYRSVNGGNNLQLRAPAGKFGIQYDHKFDSDLTMTIGATYRTRTNLKGYSYKYTYAVSSEMADTLSAGTKNDTLSRSNNAALAGEIGIGICLKGSDKWMVELDYTRSDWTKSGFDKTTGFAVTGIGGNKFSTTAAQSFRAGFEIVPNRNDIRYYFKRCAYRAGIYYDKSYYKLDGNIVDSKGISLGITLPVLTFYNGITLGVDLGQKGSKRNDMIRERYATFNIGFNIHDIWFIKQRYE